MRDAKLGLLRFIQSHGFEAWIIGDGVKWLCPYITKDRETGLMEFYAKSYKEALDQLGY